MDVGVDTGMEQVALAGDFLLPSVAEGSFSVGEDLTLDPFSVGEDLMLDPFLYDRGPVLADLGYNPDVFEAGESVVYEETLGQMGVEGGEVIVLSWDARGSSRAGMEYFSIDPLGGVDTALDHGDLPVEGIADVGAGLGATPLVKV